MPYFYFDLVVGEEFKGQGGMILEDTQIAFEKADSLASELYIVRPELRSRGCAVRLTTAKIRNSIAPRLILSQRGPQHAEARDTICLCGATLPGPIEMRSLARQAIPRSPKKPPHS